MITSKTKNNKFATKIALGIEYDGSDYFGWQRQQTVSSIQEELETALTKIANEAVTVFCAGRTDAGVHATGQVIHFETTSQRANNAWVMGTNTHLPNSIAVSWAITVSTTFHARHSATARRYRYLIYNSPSRSAIMPKGITHCYVPLNSHLMHEAAQHLLGENDFSSFRAAQCQSHTPWRNIHYVNVFRQGDYIIVDIKANAFVHHMVRNIVGSLIEVGSGKQNTMWIAELLNAKDRTLAAATAKPEGLYLVEVDYPIDYHIPQKKVGPIFLSDELT